MTYVYEDWRHNLAVDPDAAVLAWRQGKGKRLGWENSREAVAWSVFRGLEVLGVAQGVLAAALGARSATLYWWGRTRDGEEWPPFAAARQELERWIKGPDVNGAEPEVLVVDEAGKQVVAVDADVAAPVAVKPPRWFTPATLPAERRVRRAILDAMMAEEDGPVFRRGLDDVVRRGFWAQARRLLLARAAARRLGGGWRGRLVSVINPPTMRRAEEDVAKLAALVEEDGAYRALTWAELWGSVPAGARTARAGMRLSLEEYLRARTVNRVAARLIP